MAAHALGLEIVLLEIRRAQDIATAFEALKARAQALYVVGDPLLSANAARINILAAGMQLPTIYNQGESVETGGLMSYGPNFPNLFRRAADLVDKISEGRSLPIFRSSSRPNSTSSSISRPPRRSD